MTNVFRINYIKGTKKKNREVGSKKYILYRIRQKLKVRSENFSKRLERFDGIRLEVISENLRTYVLVALLMLMRQHMSPGGIYTA